jgi:hypothetical protein
MVITYYKILDFLSAIRRCMESTILDNEWQMFPRMGTVSERMIVILRETPIDIVLQSDREII